MALVTKDTDLAGILSSLEPPASHRHPGYAGEDIAAGDVCYLKTDGLLWKTDGTAAAQAANAFGLASRTVKAGDALTLIHSERLRYAASAGTPGNFLYPAATAGRLDTAPTTGGFKPCAIFLEDGIRIYFWPTWYLPVDAT